MDLLEGLYHLCCDPIVPLDHWLQIYGGQVALSYDDPPVNDRQVNPLRRAKDGRGQRVVLRPGERLDGRLRVNEMPLYETQIAAVLAETCAAGQAFQVDISERKVIVSVELNDDLFSDTMRRVVDSQRDIESDLMSKLGIPAEVRFVSPG